MLVQNMVQAKLKLFLYHSSNHALDKKSPKENNIEFNTFERYLDVLRQDR